jgi:FkbM family methyltransferase
MSYIGPMVRIGKRSLGNFLYQFTMLENFRALCRFPLVHEHPWEIFKDELLSRDVYPRDLHLRTPLGRTKIRLHHVADLSTLNLIFAREDYYAPKPCEVVIDVGANIGLSALYFLSRNQQTHVYAYEPAPPTFKKLEDNLAPYAQSVSLKQCAVSDFNGTATLGLEASGVYSALDLESEEKVEVECIDIMTILHEVLAKHKRIDVLKLDCEGHEVRILNAIDDSMWEKIRCINVDAVFECPEVKDIVPKSYRRTQRGTALRFVQRS